jgi:antitoxin component of MazEF toxin-antitoxin module
MTGKTWEGDELARLRTEGRGVVLFIPVAVRTQLAWKHGDMVVVKVVNGAMVVRKVPLDDVIAQMERGVV